MRRRREAAIAEGKKPLRLGGLGERRKLAKWSTFSALVNLIFFNNQIEKIVPKPSRFNHQIEKNSTQTFSFLTIKSKNSTETFSIYEKPLTGNLCCSGDAKSFGVRRISLLASSLKF